MINDWFKLNKQRCLLILAILKHVFEEPEEIRKHFTWVVKRQRADFRQTLKLVSAQGSSNLLTFFCKEGKFLQISIK